MAVTKSSKSYKAVQFEIIEGIKLPKAFREDKNIRESFSVRDDDIWLTSFPKSGTTWSQELIWLVANDLDYEGAKETLEKRFPFLEYGSISGKERERFIIDNNLKSNKPKALPAAEHIKRIEEISTRRFIKTHLNWNLLPKQITDGSKTPKIIHILRNPKQVAVSYHHHTTKINQCFIGDITDFVDLFIKGEVLYGDYFTNVFSYWQRRTLQNLLLITYEDMKQNLRSVIGKVADFLGKSLTEEEIDKLERHLSFEEMKENYAVNKRDILNDVEFFRRGTVDSYKEELSHDSIQKLDQWIQENIQGSGLPYETNM